MADWKSVDKWTGMWGQRAAPLLQKGWVHHLLPLLVFGMFMTAYFGYNEWQYRKDPDGRTAKFSFEKTFLQGKYDQGIYRGIGVTLYRDGKRSGWYPGASIAGGIGWRLMGKPDEGQPGPDVFFLCFFIPSILYGVAFFYCFYRYAYLKWGTGAGVLSLLSLVSFPPSFYYLTAFPYNMGLACMTAYLLVYEGESKRRYLWLGLLGFFCSITYPTTFLFAVFPVMNELVKQVGQRRFRPLPYLYYGMPFVLGPLTFFTYLHVVTGDFLGYVNHQGAHYERVFGSPLQVVLSWFQEHPLTYPENLTAVLVMLYLALFATKKIGAGLWCYMLALMVFSPFTGSFQCVYRHYLLAFPLHYLFATSTKPLWIKLPLAGIYSYIGLKYFFWLYLDNILT